MKSKGFLRQTGKIKREMETRYGKLVAVRNSVLLALTHPQEEEKKRILFQGMRRIQTILSKEVPVLRTKPKRATKFSVFAKRIINMLKMALDTLSDDEQAEVYPTLALICSHFVDIILHSTLTEKLVPKFAACQLYCFIKTVFNIDMEFALDVLICSNVFDDAVTPNSMGFYMLTEVIMDNHLFTDGKEVFAKYLTILAFLKKNTEGRGLKAKIYETIKELDSHSVDLPKLKDVQDYFETEFKMKFKGKKKSDNNRQLQLGELIDNIKARRVANITRRKRLVIVKKQGRIKSTSTENGQKVLNSSASNVNGDLSSLFFFDPIGQLAEDDEKSPEIEDLQFDFEPNQSQSESTAKDSGNDSPADSHVILPSEDEEEEEEVKARTPKKGKAQALVSSDSDAESDSSDDLKVVFADPSIVSKSAGFAFKAPPKNLQMAIDNEDDDSDDEERDFADPESGEDELPEYSDDDYSKSFDEPDEPEETEAKKESEAVLSDSSTIDIPLNSTELHNTIEELNKLKSPKKNSDSDSEGEFTTPNGSFGNSQTSSSCLDEKAKEKSISPKKSDISMSPSKSPQKSIESEDEEEEEPSPKRKRTRSSKESESDKSEITPTRRRKSASLSPVKLIKIATTRLSTPSISVSSDHSDFSLPDLILKKIPVTASPTRQLRSRSRTPSEDGSPRRKGANASMLKLTPVKEEDGVSPARGGGRGRGRGGRVRKSMIATKKSPSTSTRGRGRGGKYVVSPRNIIKDEEEIVSPPKRGRKKKDTAAVATTDTTDSIPTEVKTRSLPTRAARRTAAYRT